MDAERLERLRVETNDMRRLAENDPDVVGYCDGVLEVIYDHRPADALSEGMEILLAGVEVGSISELRRLVEAGRDREAVVSRIDALEAFIDNGFEGLSRAVGGYD